MFNVLLDWSRKQVPLLPFFWDLHNNLLRNTKTDFVNLDDAQKLISYCLTHLDKLLTWRKPGR